MARLASDVESEEETTVKGEKCRRERRKDARKAKKQKILQSWQQHQIARKKNKEQDVVELPKVPEPCVLPVKELFDSVLKEEQDAEREIKCPRKKKEEKEKSKKRKKTKFEEFMSMEKNKIGFTDQIDLETEKKLAKKLKIKNGKLGGLDDGLDMLLDGIPSVVDEENKGFDDELHSPISSTKKRKKSKKKESSSLPEENSAENKEVALAHEPTKYVAPHLRQCSNSDLEEMSQMRRRVRGLLNRLSESNIEAITHSIAEIYQSTRRSISCQVLCEEVLSSCSQGPRGNEQYAAVFAAFVAGMTCSVGVDFGAKLMASLAQSFEEEYQKKDGLSLRNLTLLFSYLFIFGTCSTDLVYDFLSVLTRRLTEMDVATILTVLQCCGMKLRASDPSAMKQFIVDVQSRVNELEAESPSGRSKRMDFMLETICDIKNNKKKAKEDSVPHTRIKKWLQKLRGEDIMLRNLSWVKLVDPEKKGQWWLSGEQAAATGSAAVEENVKELAAITDQQAAEAQRLIQLAASQRMNTDIRRAIFCIIISAEDYVDAFEKILRLDLSGKQDREIMRVLVECCLQEKVYNPYYAVLGAKLCAHHKNHKFTLQYCLWDHYKELDSMDLARSRNLARFTAAMLTSFSLPLAALKVVDFGAAAGMAARKVMHFRMMFEELLAAADTNVWNVFTRIVVVPELEDLRTGLEFFIARHVATSDTIPMKAKFKLTRKALHNVEGVLM
ncbi:MIF4G domain-containing protein / MA3 domain-containing protein [Wolffia australiana]